MNPYIQQYNQYKQNSIITASPEAILIMLYEGAIKFLMRAKVSIDNKNIEETHELITKAEKIIRELMNSLDMETGGEVAQNLYRLYEYLHHQLVMANIKKDNALIDGVLEHLRDLKQTWEEAIKIASRESKEYGEEENDRRA